MLSDPDLNSILEKVDCRYTLVVEVSKRARQLISGDEPLAVASENNPVSIAAKEVDEKKIHYERQQ